VPNAYISGTGFYVPPRVVTNDDLADQYGIDTTDEWIYQRTKIKERRYADEGVSASDLALHASESAIKRAGIDNSVFNINGGAISIGHPYGMTGARCVGHALLEGKRQKAKYACVTMCIGGGMGAAGLFEIC